MPARAVVLNGIRKNDGAQFRVLNPSETTQIAGTSRCEEQKVMQNLENHVVSNNNLYFCEY